MRKQIIYSILTIIILTSMALLCYTRWDAWFTNPEEPEWEGDTIAYHFNGFGQMDVPGFVHTGMWWQDTLQPDTLQIAVFGDVHNSMDSTQWRTISERHPNIDCYAQTGDFMERGYFYYYQLLVEQILPSRFADLPIIATPGNHEYKKGIIRTLSTPWNTWFNNPKNGPSIAKNTTYYIDFNGLRFIVIDTNGLQLLSDYTRTNTWVNQVIADAGDKYTVVIMHHPVISGAVGRQNLGIYFNFRLALSKADIVFSGHDHGYMRQLPFIGINSAEKFYLSKVNSNSQRICNGRQMYEILTLTNNRLNVKTYLTDTGDLYDNFTVVHHSDGHTEYIIHPCKTDEIIDLPEKYLQQMNKPKVKHFLNRRNKRLNKQK